MGPLEKRSAVSKNLKSVAKRVSLTDVSQFVLDEQSVIRDPQDVCTRQSGVEERVSETVLKGGLCFPRFGTTCGTVSNYNH